MVCQTGPASLHFFSNNYDFFVDFFFLSSCFSLAFLNSLNTNCKNTKKKYGNKLEKGLLFPIFRIL